MKDILSSKEKREAMIFPVLDILLNGFNFLVILLISLQIGQDEFSVFSALIAFVSVLFILGISIQMYMAKAVAQIDLQTKRRIKYHVLRGLIAVNIILILGLNPMKHFLRTSTIGYYMILLMLTVHTLLSFQRGIMQGRKKFRRLNISFYIEVLVRIVMTIILLKIKKTYEMALLAIVIGMGLSYLHSLYYDKKEMYRVYKLQESIKAHNPVLRNMLNVLMASGCLYYLANINIMIMNNRFSEVSGTYSLSSKFSQLFIAVSISIVTILVPIASDSKMTKDRLKVFIHRSTRNLFGLLIAMWIGYITLLPLGIHWVFGNQYPGLIENVRIQAVGYIFFGVTQFLVAMEIVLEGKRYIIGLVIACVLYTVLLSVLPKHLLIILIAEISIHVTVCISLLIHRFERSDPYEKETIIPIMERH